MTVELPTEPRSEARFTWTTNLCPHPDRWTSTDGDSTEIEVSDLAWGLVRALQPSWCLETGSGYGQTSRRIVDALVSNGHGLLMTIEPDPDRVAATLSRFDSTDPVNVVTAESLMWQPPVGLTIDFFWLDSYYEFRVPEFWRFFPWMRQGTIVCFHDTAPEHGAHRIPSGRDLRAEIEHELSSVIRVIHLPTPRGVSIAEVVQA